MSGSPVTTAGTKIGVELEEISGEQYLVIEFGDKAEDLLDFTMDQARILFHAIQQALWSNQSEIPA